MKRGNFLKSLLTVIAAPSLIENLEIKKALPIVSSNTYPENFGMLIPQSSNVYYHYENNVEMMKRSSQLFTDLNELTPTHIAEIERKYGYVSYEWTPNKNNKL